MLQTTVQAATSEIITDLLMTQCGDIQEDDNIENNNETLVESAEVSHSDNKKCTSSKTNFMKQSKYALWIFLIFAIFESSLFFFKHHESSTNGNGSGVSIVLENDNKCFDYILSNLNDTTGPKYNHDTNQRTKSDKNSRNVQALILTSNKTSQKTNCLFRYKILYFHNHINSTKLSRTTGKQLNKDKTEFLYCKPTILNSSMLLCQYPVNN